MSLNSGQISRTYNNWNAIKGENIYKKFKCDRLKIATNMGLVHNILQQLRFDLSFLQLFVSCQVLEPK